VKRKPWGGSGTGHGRFVYNESRKRELKTSRFAETELRKLQKCGQFPDDPGRIKSRLYSSVKRRLIYEYRCDVRLKTKNEESTLLGDTGLVVELEHPRFEDRRK
jgi:hypothetical protein